MLASLDTTPSTLNFRLVTIRSSLSSTEGVPATTPVPCDAGRSATMPTFDPSSPLNKAAASSGGNPLHSSPLMRTSKSPGCRSIHPMSLMIECNERLTAKNSHGLRQEFEVSNLDV